MGGSSLAPEVLRAVIGVAPGWPRFHMLDSTDPAAVRAVAHAARARRCISSPASRARPSSRTRSPRTSGSGSRRRRRALGRSLRRHHRRRHRARRAGARGTLPRRLHQPVRHRRPLLGAVVLRAGAGGADGPGHRRAGRLGPGDARRRASPATATVDGNPAVGLGLVMAAGALTRPRQADAGRAAGARAVRPLGRTAGRREHRQAAASASSRSPAKRSAPPDVYGADRLFVRLQLDGATTPDDDARGRAISRRSARRSSTIDAARAGRARRRVRALGDCDRGRRRAARASIRSTSRTCSRRRTRRSVLLDALQGRRAAAGSPPPDRTDADGVTLTLTSAARTRARHGATPMRILTLDRAGRLLRAPRLPRSGRRRSRRRCTRFRTRGARSHPGGDDVRLRAAVSALDRPAAQRRAEHRRVRADHRRRRRGPADSRRAVSRSARSSSRRRSAISPRSTRPAAAPCTCTCPRRIRALVRCATRCWTRLARPSRRAVASDSSRTGVVADDVERRHRCSSVSSVSARWA